MVVGKKETGKKVWSVNKKLAKIVSRKKILGHLGKIQSLFTDFFFYR